MLTDYKECSICITEKPLSDFPKNRNQCRKCFNRRVKQQPSVRARRNLKPIKNSSSHDSVRKTAMKTHATLHNLFQEVLYKAYLNQGLSESHALEELSSERSQQEMDMMYVRIHTHARSLKPRVNQYQ